MRKVFDTIGSLLEHLDANRIPVKDVRFVMPDGLVVKSWTVRIIGGRETVVVVSDVVVSVSDVE